MKISDKGVLEIAEHEGIVLGPYKDSKGIWTYGVGHTNGAGAPDPKSMPMFDTRNLTDTEVQFEILRALRLFDEDLNKYEARVNDAVKPSIAQHQFDALVSFDFNTGGIYRAKLTKQINAGNMSGAGFMGWLRPREIYKRRKAEQVLFQRGDYEANGSLIPIYDALGNGRFKYRSKISGHDLHDLMKKAGSRRLPAKEIVKFKMPEKVSFLDAIMRALAGLFK